jgi:hypothetical protein
MNKDRLITTIQSPNPNKMHWLVDALNLAEAKAEQTHQRVCLNLQSTVKPKANAPNKHY